MMTLAVMPADAGIALKPRVCLWNPIPAFAGMTLVSVA